MNSKGDVGSVHRTSCGSARIKRSSDKNSFRMMRIYFELQIITRPSHSDVKAITHSFRMDTCMEDTEKSTASFDQIRMLA